MAAAGTTSAHGAIVWGNGSGSPLPGSVVEVAGRVGCG